MKTTKLKVMVGLAVCTLFCATIVNAYPGCTWYVTVACSDAFISTGSGACGNYTCYVDTGHMRTCQGGFEFGLSSCSGSTWVDNVCAANYTCYFDTCPPSTGTTYIGKLVSTPIGDDCGDPPQ
jgi:hypothetical protein